MLAFRSHCQFWPSILGHRASQLGPCSHAVEIASAEGILTLLDRIHIYTFMYTHDPLSTYAHFSVAAHGAYISEDALLSVDVHRYRRLPLLHAQLPPPDLSHQLGKPFLASQCPKAARCLASFPVRHLRPLPHT